MPFPSLNRFGFIKNPILHTPFVANNDGEGTSNILFGVRVTENDHYILLTEEGFIRVVETQTPINNFLLLNSDNFLLLNGDDLNLL